MKIMRKTLLFAVILLFAHIPFAFSQELSESERKTLEQRIIEKINDFISYLPEIAAKSDKSYEEKRLALRYIDRTLDLFIGKGEDYQYIVTYNGRRYTRWHDAVKMQTTSRGIPNKPQPMKRYLHRLMALNYQKVEVDSCSAVRIDKRLHKVGENRYTATATFVQIFRGWRDGRLVISDIDPKQVTVYVEKIVIDGGVYVFDVKLGDIRITSDWGEG